MLNARVIRMNRRAPTRILKKVGMEQLVLLLRNK